MKTSTSLQVGQIYTRQELQELFNITDATIRTGVFRPKGHDSVWLFVTEQKATGQTQYTDHLEDSILHWDGQTSGRTDRLIIEHKKQGLELLIFYRKHRAEHPGYGFCYEGTFEYVSHSGGQPSHFILKRVSSS